MTIESRKPKMLELFAGTRSIGKAFERAGWETYSVEWNKDFENITLYADISELTADKVIEICGGKPDVIWASPDCSSYSCAALGYHRRLNPDTKLLEPKTEYAGFCDKTNAHVVDLIRELNPTYFFIENPVGALRKMPFMSGIPRHTVTYCQYGETRQKPTDIWTNHPNPQFKPACKRGMPCHEAAPRGTRNGTQKLKTSRERARIPDELCDHVASICGGLME